MRRLADRSLYLGIRLCVFLAILLFGMTLSLREAEAGTELRISPEFFVDETSGILFLCEVENESEREIPEVYLSLRLPEGSESQVYSFATAEFLREGTEGVRYDSFPNGEPLQIFVPSLKPGELCLLQAEGTVAFAETSEGRRTELELEASLRRGEEEHTTRKRYDLSGRMKVSATDAAPLLGERIGTAKKRDVNQQAELRRTELPAGQLELDLAKAAPPAEGRRQTSGLPVTEILVCSLALWMLSILLKQLAVYFEEGRRKFDPKRKRSPRKDIDKDEKRD